MRGQSAIKLEQNCENTAPTDWRATMSEITDHMIETLIEKWQHTLDWLSNYDSESDDNA